MPSWYPLIGVTVCIILSPGNGQNLLLSTNASDVCVGDAFLFICEQSGTFSGIGDLINFHKNGNEASAECTIDLNSPCSPTFPANSPCGCVSNSGGVRRHEYVIPSATKQEAASWTCVRTGVPASGTVRSNAVASSITAGVIPKNVHLSLTYDKDTRTLSCNGPTSMGDTFLQIKQNDTDTPLVNGSSTTLTLKLEDSSVSGPVTYVCSLSGNGTRCSGVIVDGVYTVQDDMAENCKKCNCSPPCAYDYNVGFVSTLGVCSAADLLSVMPYVRPYLESFVVGPLQLRDCITITVVGLTIIFESVVIAVPLILCRECLSSEYLDLYSGAIAVVVIGVLCILAACVAMAVSMKNRRKPNESSGEQGGDDVPDNKSESVPLGEKNATNGGGEGGGGTEKSIPSLRRQPIPPRAALDPSSGAQKEQMSDERSGSTPLEKKKKKKKKQTKDTPLPMPEQHVGTEIKDQ